MNILLIAFLFDPDKSVGALRPTYWAEQLANTGHRVTVFTSIPSEKSKSNYRRVVVPYQPKPQLLPIADQGISWMPAIKKSFRDLNEGFDQIIITGGPFLHFLLSKWFKSHTNSKIILDFRDPFAINPRFNDSRLKILLKSFLERRMCKYADSIITVNPFVAKLIKTSPEKISIIENGFNETLIDQVKNMGLKSTPNTVLHAGKTSADRNPIPLIKAIKEMPDFTLYHFGTSIDYVSSPDNFHEKGFIPYSEILKKIATSEICIVLTNGEDFVSTTKIFDYLGLNKKILIITNGEKNKGNLEAITHSNPNVKWAYNDPSDIRIQISSLAKMEHAEIDSSKFSRLFQFSKLENLIKNQ